MQKPLQVKVIEWRFDLWAGSATRLSAILPVVWLIGCCQLTGAEGVQTERRESLRANLARLKSGVSWVEISGDDDQWSSVEANVTNADEVAELVTSLEFERDEEPESFGVGIHDNQINFYLKAASKTVIPGVDDCVSFQIEGNRVFYWSVWSPEWVGYRARLTEVSARAVDRWAKAHGVSFGNWLEPRPTVLEIDFRPGVPVASGIGFLGFDFNQRIRWQNCHSSSAHCVDGGCWTTWMNAKLKSPFFGFKEVSLEARYDGPGVTGIRLCRECRDKKLDKELDGKWVDEVERFLVRNANVKFREGVKHDSGCLYREGESDNLRFQIHCSEASCSGGKTNEKWTEVHYELCIDRKGGADK